jgi:RimJ/RimL family protein N-acetyltransferase
MPRSRSGDPLQRRGQAVDETRSFLDQTINRSEADGYGVSAGVVRASGKLAGRAGLSIPSFLPQVFPPVEVAWRLGEAFRGLGYATEAGRAWVHTGFDQRGLSEILSIYEPDNQPSGAVRKRLGFQFVKKTRYPEYGITLHVAALTRGGRLQHHVRDGNESGVRHRRLLAIPDRSRSRKGRT